MVSVLVVDDEAARDDRAATQAAGTIPGGGAEMSAPHPKARIAAMEGAVLETRQGSETVLVVEDEVALRRISRRILEKHGYRVYTAADGEEALRVLAEHPAGIDLVFTDLVMPKMGGAALYERVRQEGGPLRFLAASGYSGGEARREQGLPAGVPFVTKPWTLNELLEGVREALDAPVATLGRGASRHDPPGLNSD